MGGGVTQRSHKPSTTSIGSYISALEVTFRTVLTSRIVPVAQEPENVQEEAAEKTQAS